MTCPGCASETLPGARFCAECGTKLVPRACPACGTAVERGRFCPECGTPLGDDAVAARAPALPVAERRIASIMFGDIVGFTPLSETRDAEEVRELLSRYFATCRVVIERFGGTVEKFIGDAVMAVWGVPVAHGDDAERAVRAGLDLVSAVSALGAELGMPGLAMRVGIVTGEVAVTVGATSEGMVAGDAVNTAARVQASATPDRVWVDDPTRSLAGSAITFTDAGSHELKGKAGETRLWEVLAVVAEVGGASRVDGLEAPMTGRDGDLRVLKELFHATEASGRPRLVVVDGDAGVGKSRLAWEFEKYVDGLTARTRWHRGRCLSYGDGIAFWPLSEALRARFGLVEGDTSETVAQRLEERLREFVPDEHDREWLSPRLAVLLGTRSSSAFTREDLFASWTAFFEHLSRTSDSVTLVLDDAQHADDSMVDFLDHLLSTARAPIFVLALARPELLERHPDMGGRRASTIHLEPLEDPTMAALVDGLVANLPEAARAALVERADGIPLYAVETVRALIDRDIVVPREGRYVLVPGRESDIESVAAPLSLQALVAARLDGLSADEKRVVNVASVLGLTFTVPGLLALGIDADLVEGTVSSLARKEIFALQTDRFSAELGQYRFLQSVVRQVAYSTQSRRDRKARHLAAAAYLESLPEHGDDLSVLVAQHLIDASEASSADDSDMDELSRRACRHLQRAARRALTLGATAEAQHLFEQALARTTDPQERAALLLAASRAALDAGHYAEGSVLASDALAQWEELGDDVQAGMAAAQAARALTLLNDNVSALALGETWWNRLAGDPAADLPRLGLAESLARITFQLGDVDRQQYYAHELLLLAEATGGVGELAIAHIESGLAHAATGAPRSSELLYRAAADLARGQGLMDPLGRALATLGGHLNSRDVEGALAASTEAIDVARRAGLRARYDLAMINKLLGLWMSGRLEEARDQLDQILTAFGILDDPTTAAVGLWLADAVGDPAPFDADALSQTVEDAVQERVWAAAVALSLDGAVGEDEAGALVRQTMDDFVLSTGLEDDFVFTWPVLVQRAVELRDPALMADVLRPVQDAAHGRIPPAVSAMSHRMHAWVGAALGGDPAVVDSSFRQAVDSLDAFGARGYAAQCRAEHGRWLQAQGRFADAAPVLDEARASFASIGAHGWLAHLDVGSGAQHAV